MNNQRGGAKAVWRERLARYRSSGITVQEFCRQEQVSTASFYAWKRRLGQHNGNSPLDRQQTPLFVPLELKSVPATEVRIILPGGAVVHVPHDVDERLLTCCIRHG